MKDKHFRDWESETFGYGYGTGEEYTLKALKEFFSMFPENYDFQVVEKIFSPLSAWLLINILCKADILEYGTSPRFGWYTEKGQILREYLKDKTLDELYEIVGQDYGAHCYKTHCNCDKKCNNPLF